MNTKEKFYQKIQEATMSQLRDRLMPDRTNDAYKMAKKNIDSKLEMDNIQKDPKLALGYDTLKDKDTGILNIGQEARKDVWGSFNPSKKSISINKRVAQYPNKPISDERFKATTTHELGHAASERLNPVNKKDGKYNYGNMPLKYGAKRTPVVTDTGKIVYHDPGTEELRQRRADLTYRTGKPREDSLKWTTALHDRDQQALDKINDTDRNRARQILYKKYGAADRSTMTDRDLGKTATGTIIPEEIKIDIKENFYQKLQESREQLDELKGKGSLEKIRDHYTKRRNKAKSNAEKIIGDEEFPLKTIHWNSEVGKHNAYGAKAERAKDLIRLRDKNK